jgi:DnaJ-class molecular chaperone
MMRRLTIRFFFSLQKFDPKKDYYKVLLLSENATPEQIKTSFRNLAKKHHPDTKKGNEEMFK